MYCEGGRSRTGKVAEQAKRGIGRLALETGAPVVPIAIYGSSHIRNWKRLQFPKVTVQYGEPIRWEPIEDPTREQQQAVADQVLVEIRRLYAGLEEHGRKGILRRVREQRRAERRHAQGRRRRLSAGEPSGAFALGSRGRHAAMRRHEAGGGMQSTA